MGGTFQKQILISFWGPAPKSSERPRLLAVLAAFLLTTLMVLFRFRPVTIAEPIERSWMLIQGAANTIHFRTKLSMVLAAWKESSLDSESALAHYPSQGCALSGRNTTGS